MPFISEISNELLQPQLLHSSFPLCGKTSVRESALSMINVLKAISTLSPTCSVRPLEQITFNTTGFLIV
jgi:hypothetical protein